MFRNFTISLMDLDDYYSTKFSCAQCSETFPALEVSRACYSFKVSRFYEFPNNTFHGMYLLLVSCSPAGFPTCCRSFNRDNHIRNMNKKHKTFCRAEYNSLPIFLSLSAVLSANHLCLSFGFSFATFRLFSSYTYSYKFFLKVAHTAALSLCVVTYFRARFPLFNFFLQLFSTCSLLRVSQLSRPFWHNCYVFSRPFQPLPIFPPFSPAPGFSTLATNFFLFPLFHPFNVSEHFLPSLNTHCNFPRFTIPFSSFPLFSST